MMRLLVLLGMCLISVVAICEDKAQTPHRLLCSGHPEQALAILKQDPDWVEVAAYFGNHDALLAMLGHKQFQNRSQKLQADILTTCLSQSVSPRVLEGDRKQVKLVDVLLNAGADPNVIVWNDATLIKHTASCLHPTNVNENRQLTGIIQSLVRHGAKLDLYSAVAINSSADVGEAASVGPSRQV